LREVLESRKGEGISFPEFIKLLEAEYQPAYTRILSDSDVDIVREWSRFGCYKSRLGSRKVRTAISIHAKDRGYVKLLSKHATWNQLRMHNAMLNRIWTNIKLSAKSNADIGDDMRKLGAKTIGEYIDKLKRGTAC
jgi:hypothetical protein